ncbi:hypothetical protein p2 [Esparto virus]|uniref:Uncharacterized protein n=1 Tax=Esparto virus TaxID=2072209 RepID=A0A2I7G2V4_9VIRU|nr:hypothetical protein p2 [Esparto virus]AUQ43963.1 hypothetical protein p2 [Esparto virus]
MPNNTSTSICNSRCTVISFSIICCIVLFGASNINHYHKLDISDIKDSLPTLPPSYLEDYKRAGWYTKINSEMFKSNKFEPTKRTNTILEDYLKSDPLNYYNLKASNIVAIDKKNVDKYDSLDGHDNDHGNDNNGQRNNNNHASNGRIRNNINIATYDRNIIFDKSNDDDTNDTNHNGNAARTHLNSSSSTEDIDVVTIDDIAKPPPGYYRSLDGQYKRVDSIANKNDEPFNRKANQSLKKSYIRAKLTKYLPNISSFNNTIDDQLVSDLPSSSLTPSPLSLSGTSPTPSPLSSKSLTPPSPPSPSSPSPSSPSSPSPSPSSSSPPSPPSSSAAAAVSSSKLSSLKMIHTKILSPLKTTTNFKKSSNLLPIIETSPLLDDVRDRLSNFHKNTARLRHKTHNQFKPHEQQVNTPTQSSNRKDINNKFNNPHYQNHHHNHNHQHDHHHHHHHHHHNHQLEQEHEYHQQDNNHNHQQQHDENYETKNISNNQQIQIIPL